MADNETQLIDAPNNDKIGTDAQVGFLGPLQKDGTREWKPPKMIGGIKTSGIKRVFSMPSRNDLVKKGLKDSNPAGLPYGEDLTLFDQFLEDNNFCSPPFNFEGTYEEREPLAEVVVARRAFWSFLLGLGS